MVEFRQVVYGSPLSRGLHCRARPIILSIEVSDPLHNPTDPGIVQHRGGRHEGRPEEATILAGDESLADADVLKYLTRGAPNDDATVKEPSDK